MLPWLLCGILALAAAILAWKLFFLRRSLDQLARQTGERLDQDTNNLLFTSTRDRAVRRLAAELNKHLHRLLQARQQYENGDRALKEAITSISHDLRTPLTAIWGYLELLEREELPDSVCPRWTSGSRPCGSLRRSCFATRWRSPPGRSCI